MSAEIESESKEYTRLLKDIVEKNEKYILDEIKTLKEKLKRLELTKETPKNKKMKEKFNQILKRKLAFYNNAKLGNTYPRKIKIVYFQSILYYLAPMKNTDGNNYIIIYFALMVSTTL